MSSKIQIVKAFIQYGVLSVDAIKSRNRNHLETLIKRGMKKINANLLLTNIPETGETELGHSLDITPEVIYDTLGNFDSPIEVLHHCKNVYVALVKDPKSCVDQLSGNKIGRNTIKATAYQSFDSPIFPHEGLNIYFPVDQESDEDEIEPCLSAKSNDKIAVGSSCTYLMSFQKFMLIMLVYIMVLLYRGY